MSKKKDKMEIPTFESQITKIGEILKDNTSLGMLLIDTLSLEVADIHNSDVIDYSVVSTFKDFLSDFRGKHIRKDDIMTVDLPKGNKYYIFLSKPRIKPFFLIEDYESLSRRISHEIQRKLFSTVLPIIKKEPKIKIGYAVTFYNPSIKTSNLLTNMINTAQSIATYREIKDEMIKKQLLYQIVIEENISTNYQPIINLNSQEIIGYEAFTHGPKDTIFEIPSCFFNFAEECGLLSELDWLCKKHIIKNAKGLPPDKKLFIKSITHNIHDVELRIKYLSDVIKKTQIDNKNIVFEISEKEILNNYSVFKKLKDLFKDMMFAFVIDELWTESHLENLNKFPVSFIKLKMPLIRNIDTNDDNRKIITKIKNICELSHIHLIAEGLHKKKELKTLLNLQIEYGQGYLIARPGPPFPEIKIMEIYIEDKDLHKKILSSIYYKRGISYFNQGRYDQSILELSKVLEIEPENIETLYYRSYAYLEEGSTIAAMNDIEKLLKLEPNHINALLLKAMICEKNGEKDNAILFYNQFIEKAPITASSKVDLAKQRVENLSS